MSVQLECSGGDVDVFGDSVVAVLKLRGQIELVAPGALPNDGLVIDDQRSYE
jgi:phenylacetate-CoA ligase